MRKLLLAGSALALFAAAPALAADLPAQAIPAKAPVYIPPPVYNWNGFYVGGHVGGGWSSQQATELAPGTAAFPTGTVFNKNNMSGFLGGVQGGFNWQVSSVVFGIEGEYSWANVNGSVTTQSVVPASPGFTSNVTAKDKDYALATGRIGYAADNWLFFAKGGGAWGQTNSTGTGLLGNGTVFETNTANSNRSGWVVGAGVEWGFAPNWSAKIEYNHIDFGSSTVTVLGTTTGASSISVSNTVEVVKGGVNYRFNWGSPVVAKY